MTWDEVKELGPLYALGALDVETAQKVEEFLRHATKEQQKELTEWREVAALLPTALPSTPAPLFLKDRLMTRIAGEGASASPLQNGTSAKVLQFQPRPRGQSQLPRFLAIAAILALAFTTAFLAWKNTELTSRLRVTEGQFKEMVSSDTQIISMGGVESPQAHAKVIWNKTTQTWKVYINNLPVPASDKDYQLWYVTTQDAKINAKVFSPNAQGSAELSLSLPQEAIQGLAATAVTLEPKGGSLQPTGKFYLLAKI